jgi:hypothetical protein
MSNHDLPPLVPPGGPVPPTTSSYHPPQPSYPGQAPYRGPVRTPSEPSTGAGWTIVALLSWWPFAIAAYPHTQRAAAALGAGDRQRAELEGAKARRVGIAGLVYAIVLSSVLTVGMLIGMFALALWVGSAAVEAQSGSATDYAPDDEPGSGPVDGVSVWELSEGDCYLTDGLTEVVRTVAVVPCNEPHGGEMYNLTFVAGNTFGMTDAVGYPVYPGDAEMGRHADGVCRTELEELTGTVVAESGLSYWYTAPDAWAWRTMDRRITCFAESDADDVTRRISDR